MVHVPPARLPEVPDQGNSIAARDVVPEGNRRGSPSWVLADELLAFARRDRRVIYAFQMQKLIYLAEGWMYVVHRRSLVREPFIAGDYGPVLGDLEHPLRRFGAGPIQRDLFVHEAGAGALDGVEPLSLEEVAILDGIWNAYGAMSVPQLNCLICEPGGPWETARRRQTQGRSATISGEAVAAWLVDQLNSKAGITLGSDDDYRTVMMEAARVSVHLKEAGVKMYYAERADAMSGAARSASETAGGDVSAERWRRLGRLAAALAAAGTLLLVFAYLGLGEVGP